MNEVKQMHKLLHTHTPNTHIHTHTHTHTHTHIQTHTGRGADLLFLKVPPKKTVHL